MQSYKKNKEDNISSLLIIVKYISIITYFHPDGIEL